jgi:GH15 family glucan-1,4-alpha-glucosidase
MSRRPIGDYALISNCHSAALISSEGSVDWLCFPRFDSPSVFGRLLDGEAGHWLLRPTKEHRSRRRFVDRTMILETTFETPSGTLVLVDGMAVGRNERGHELGAQAPRALLRRITCTRGQAEIEMEYAPRPEYGLVCPLLTPVEGGVSASGGADVLVLSTPLPLRIEDGETVGRARFVLRSGESLCFALQHRSTWEAPRPAWRHADIDARIEDTTEAWRTWSDLHQRYEGPWKELVHHSGRVLYSLTFFPTGAIVAAPTTSLPESPGGPRNWDYRYTWVRDASLTVEALWVAACPDEVEKFLDFLANTAITQVRRQADLQIMFGVGGEHDLSERELPHLSGWRQSRPVRVGNGAWNQRQLDVYGELLGAVYRLRDRLANLGQVTRDFLVIAADTAAARWNELDHGIWEVRGEPRAFLHSKLMCWVALDRAIRMAAFLGAEGRVPAWTEKRDEIRNAILQLGWSDRAAAFTQSFGSDELDASTLMIPVMGFLPADDPRMLSTIDAIATRLTDERGLVYRYRSHDGLLGEEGTFLLCTFWLAQAQAMAGQLDRAKVTFCAAANFANDVGLLSEETDATGELLGNFPQAFSHIGLVNAAWAITQAEERRV